MQLEHLMPYQLTGATWLQSKAQAFLGDEMGLGKSAQAIHAADRLNLKRILVLCPASLRTNWSREFFKFSPLDRPCTCAFSVQPVPRDFIGVFIVSYDLLVAPTSEKLKKALKEAPPAERDKASSKYQLRLKLERERTRFLAELKAVAWDLVILDEAHYLKERGADRTKAVYGSRTRPGLIASCARVWRLSGTPSLNNVGELWTHLKTAGLTSLAYWDFVFHFCTGFQDDWGFRIKGVQHEAELKKLMAPFLLRRLKADVLPDLPPVFWQEVVVQRAHVSLKFFQDADRHLPAQLEVAGQKLSDALRAVRRDHSVASELQLLEQQAGHLATLRRFIGLAKLPAVLDLIAEELQEGKYQKILLFAVHQQVLEEAFAHLKAFHPALVYGKTDVQKRQAEVDRFQGDSRCRVFLGNVLAAGVGLNLTAACEVGMLEQDWVPANNEQAVARAHRIGQAVTVRVRVFSLADSVDEEVNRILVRKQRELAKVFS